MIDPRIYRSALVPVVFAFVLLAFSLENRPHALTTTLAPDAFEGDRAFERAYVGDASLANRFAQRRPGSIGDGRFAASVAAQMREEGFRVRTVFREGDTIDGPRPLRTVIACAPARSTSGSSSSPTATPPDGGPRPSCPVAPRCSSWRACSAHRARRSAR